MDLKLVECKREHWEFLRGLRNSLKEGFVCQSEVPEEEHERFMGKNEKSYKVCLGDGEPVGFVGVINGDVRVGVDKRLQKQGVAKFMIKSLIESELDFYAKVKVNNEASIKLFESCGFIKKYYILEYEKPI